MKAKTQLEKDVDSSVGWLVDVAIEVMDIALKHEGYATRLVDRVCLVTACAELSGDGPLRIRCTPRVFEGKA